jgi:polyisoprenoid-binding protein YceI
MQKGTLGLPGMPFDDSPSKAKEMIKPSWTRDVFKIFSSRWSGTMAKWVIDPDHAVAKFSVRHFMIANVEGIFSKMTGLIEFDPPDLSRLSVEAAVDVKSLTTGHAEREEHLLSADYFDVENYSKIMFRSARVEPEQGNRGKIKGDLIIRGITQPVTLDFEYFGPVKSPFSGKSCVGFSASGKVNREAYGMTLSHPMEGGGLVVEKDVQIHVEVEADLAPA